MNSPSGTGCAVDRGKRLTAPNFGVKKNLENSAGREDAALIDAEKIIKALQTDPQGTLKQWAGQAQTMGGDVVERLKTDPNARNVAIAGVGGVLAGILAGKASPRFAGSVAKVGALAALGGLAYTAWKRHEAKKAGQAAPQPGDTFEAPPAGYLPSPSEGAGKLTILAMINAAKADGQIDAEEKARLFDRLGQVSLTDAEKAFLFDELAKPMNTDALIQAATSPQLAAHLYAASLMAVNPDHPQEKAYLAELAQRLKLDPELAREMHEAAYGG
jgi:uncharacterized membrane protein YebE (DUF533 family)